MPKACVLQHFCRYLVVWHVSWCQMQRLNKLNKTQIIAAFCIQSLLKAGKQKTLDNKVAEADLVYCSAYPFGWISKSNRLTTRGSIWVMKNPWLGPCTAKLCSVPPLHIYLWTLLSKQLAQQNCRGCYICMTYLSTYDH